MNPTPNLIDEYLHGLLDDAKAAEVARLAETEPVWADAVAAGRQRRSALKESLPPIEPAAELAQRTVQQIVGAERARRQRRSRIWRATAGCLTLAAAIMAAVHLSIEFSKPPHVNVELFGQQRLLADAAGSLRVRVVDRTTQQPLRGFAGRVAMSANDGAVTELASFTTDGNGIGAPRFHTPDWPSGRYRLSVSVDTPDGQDTFTPSIELRREYRLMLSTDKPVYQPGQTIHSRALALRRPDLKPVAGQSTTFTLTDPKGNVIFKREQASSRFGIAAADCELAAEATEGAYTLRCRVGDVESSSTIDVRKYVLPKFKVDVTFAEPYYRPGQTVKGTVKAGYFFGQPVANGQLAMEVRSSEPGEPILDKRSVSLADDGTFAFEFLVPQRLAGRPQDQGDARFTITALVRDTAGQEAGKTASRVVTKHDLRIEAIAEGGVLVPGLENYLYVYVTTPDGRPVKAKIRATLGSEVRNVETNDLGVARCPIRPEAAVDGFVQLDATDAQGRTGSRRIQPAINGNSDFLVRTDRAVYEAGSTMTITVVGAGAQPVFIDLIRDGQTLRTETVAIENGQGTIDLDLPAEQAGTLELCAYRFGAIEGLPVRKLRTLVVKPPQGLQVKLAADKPEYRPGENAKLEFTLTNAKGQPTPGAISLAAVDEAVYSVRAERPGLEQAFYLLEQQLLKPVTTIYPWTLDDGPPAVDPDRVLFEQALFSATARTIDPVFVSQAVRRPDGPIEVVTTQSAGPHSLVLSSFADKEVAYQKLKELKLDRIVRSWIALGIAVLLAGYVAVCQWFGTFRVLAFTLALVSLAIGLATISWLSLKASKNLPDTMAMITTEKKEATGSALPAPLPPPLSRAVKGEPAGVPAEPLRVRERFPETLLWQPELVTDDAGKATLEVPLADSITTWRLAAGAVAADGRLGALQAGIRVFQPFFVDLNLPVMLTRGDEATVPVIVSNFLDAPQTVTLTLADAGWFDRNGDATQTLELPARAVRSLSFTLKVKKAGHHTLEVAARGQGVADAVRRAIEVVPDGRPIEQVVSGMLNEPATLTVNLPADAIPDSGRLFVRLYPSAFSQLVEGLDSIFQMPYGCFEQTSSTTYPNILALDYLRRTKQSNPQIEAKAIQYIHLGYQRLVTFEVPGGGFDWYGRAPADVALTAYGLREFKDMANVHDVDPKLIARTKNWLIHKRGNDGSWDAGQRFRIGGGRPDARLVTTAYVAAAVFDGKDELMAKPTRDFLLGHDPAKIDDPYTLALVAAALQATAADGETITRCHDRLVALKKSSSDGKLVWWELPANACTNFYGAGQSANVEATALAALTLMPAGQHANAVRGALAWLVAQKDSRGTWHSTQATVLALKALTAGTGTPLGGDRERRFAISTGEQSHREIVVSGSQSDVVQFVDLTPQLQNGPIKLSIEETTGTSSAYQIVFRYHTPAPADAAPESPLSVALNYENPETRVGDAVRAAAKVTNKGDQSAPMVILDLPIPGGFAVESADFDAMVAEKKIAKYQVTPRQVIVYLRSLEAGGTLELKYRLTAQMPVTVAAPSAKAYEYYNPARRAQSVPARLTAKPQ